MIDAKRIEALLRKLSVPQQSPRADEIRGMIDEAVQYVHETSAIDDADLELVGVREADDAAWVTIEPAHVSFYV